MQIAKIQHFVELAARGTLPAASGGEMKANKIAKEIRRISKDFAGLDAEATAGACELLRLAAAPSGEAMREAVAYELRFAATGRGL